MPPARARYGVSVVPGDGCPNAGPCSGCQRASCSPSLLGAQGPAGSAYAAAPRRAAAIRTGERASRTLPLFIRLRRAMTRRHSAAGSDRLAALGLALAIVGIEPAATRGEFAPAGGRLSVTGGKFAVVRGKLSAAGGRLSAIRGTFSAAREESAAIGGKPSAVWVKLPRSAGNFPRRAGIFPPTAATLRGTRKTFRRARKVRRETRQTPRALRYFAAVRGKVPAVRGGLSAARGNVAANRGNFAQDAEILPRIAGIFTPAAVAKPSPIPCRLASGSSGSNSARVAGRAVPRASLGS